MAEIWKPVVGYEDLYEVSSDGRVRSKGRYVKQYRGLRWIEGSILKPQLRGQGYLSVWLYRHPEPRKQVSVHRLVAEAFCDRKDESYEEVNHLNENKQDNRADNLEWCTKQYNCSYGSRPAAIGKRHINGVRSKPIRQYTLSGEFVKEYPSIHEATRQTGIPPTGIVDVAKGKYSQSYGYRWQYAR